LWTNRIEYVVDIVYLVRGDKEDPVCPAYDSPITLREAVGGAR
jgi:hypothetical protein